MDALCISCLLPLDTIRSIKLRNCNFDYQSPEHLFDPSEPGGSYVCNLADPYERVVGNELVRPYSYDLMQFYTALKGKTHCIGGARMEGSW